jgi:hypothetical protein
VMSLSDHPTGHRHIGRTAPNDYTLLDLPVPYRPRPFTRGRCLSRGPGAPGPPMEANLFAPVIDAPSGASEAGSQDGP